MKNFALRIFYISDANERQNQVPLGGTTIHAIFLLTVRRIPMFFILKSSPSQVESSLKIQLAGVRRFGGVREQTNKQSNKQTYLPKVFFAGGALLSLGCLPGRTTRSNQSVRGGVWVGAPAEKF